jgi:hypothetical protein
MPHFDRFDICDAHFLWACAWHESGYITARPKDNDAARRTGNTFWRLSRMGYKPSPLLEKETLTENGLAIYRQLQQMAVARWGA